MPQADPVIVPKSLLCAFPSVLFVFRGILIRFHRRVLCPCERHCDQCGDMHSRDELLCVFVRDALTFSEMLEGDDTIG